MLIGSAVSGSLSVRPTPLTLKAEGVAFALVFIISACAPMAVLVAVCVSNTLPSVLFTAVAVVVVALVFEFVFAVACVCAACVTVSRQITHPSRVLLSHVENIGSAPPDIPSANKKTVEVTKQGEEEEEELEELLREEEEEEGEEEEDRDSGGPWQKP